MEKTIRLLVTEAKSGESRRRWKRQIGDGEEKKTSSQEERKSKNAFKITAGNFSILKGSSARKERKCGKKQVLGS